MKNRSILAIWGVLTTVACGAEAPPAPSAGDGNGAQSVEASNSAESSEHADATALSAPPRPRPAAKLAASELSATARASSVVLSDYVVARQKQDRTQMHQLVAEYLASIAALSDTEHQAAIEKLRALSPGAALGQGASAARFGRPTPTSKTGGAL